MTFPVGRALASWTFDPAPIVVVAIAGCAYERGRRRLRAALDPGRVVSTGAVACWWAGLGVILLATISPIGGLDDELLTVHMAQHLLLGLIAPLLIVIGRPVVVMTRAVDRSTAHAVRQWLRPFGVGRIRRSAPTTLAAAVGFHVGSWWAWHVPVLFDLALHHELVHLLEHATLFASGAALWWAVLGPAWQRRIGLTVAGLFGATVGTGMLAALMVLASQPIYSVSPDLAQWGLSAMSDQQLAGAVMWVPGGFIYLGAVSVLLVRWLGSEPGPGLAPTSMPANP